MCIRIDGHPPLANDMAWSEARCRKSISPRLPQEPTLDLGLVDAVGIDRVWTVDLGGRNRRSVSVYPNGTAEEIVLNPAVQRLHELLCSLEFEGDHVNHDVRIEGGDPRSVSYTHLRAHE